MKLGKYLKDKFVTLVSFMLFMFLTSILLWLFHSSKELLIMYSVLAVIFLLIAVGWDFIRRKKYYDKLLKNLEQLDKKYLVLETIKEPDFYEGKLNSQIMYEINKNMAENVKQYEKNVVDFKEYIEMWVHEVKLPISSLLLMCHNNKGSVEKKYIKQIKRLDNYTEQVLYYVRSEHAEKDYCIKEVPLKKVVRDVALKNKDDLLEQEIDFIVDEMEHKVSTDYKWLVFILNQIISNSMKYKRQNVTSKIHLWEEEIGNRIILHIKDNGIGIPDQDLPKVYKKSFTGENGRKHAKSTGMGLYIVKSLCDRLGHGILIKSVEGEYTEVSLVFAKNDWYKM
ncbi:MAG: HAMP domain-containing histidine kinase [Lachnospiraceae bacterium]|nr:HAMP domain-containing histidine kinase [Lachnospiraceae bacterium]